MGFAGKTDGTIHYDDQYRQTADKNVGHLKQSLTKDEWDFLDAWFATTPNSGENLSLLKIIADLFMPKVKIPSINMKDNGSADYTVILPGEGTYIFRPMQYIAQVTADSALAGDCAIRIGTADNGDDILADQVLTGLNDTDKTYSGSTKALAPAIIDNATLHLQVTTPDSGTSGTMQVWILGKLLPMAPPV